MLSTASPKLLRIALILGLVSATGPFAIDMYLPALPSIGRTLGASSGAVQMSLMAFFISLGVGQLVYGPLSDMLGRKGPLYFGLVLFVAASIGCAFAPDVHTLIAFRFVQGIGACAGMVVPRAVVRDLYTGNEAARLMSLLMLVFSVSPILAPLTGSFIIEVAGWRWVFGVVAILSTIGIGLLALFLEETRPPSQRVESSARGAMEAYVTLLRDRRYLGIVFVGAFGISSFFAYLANSSFILVDHYGLSARQYGLAFSANAASFIGASQLTGMLSERFGLTRMVRAAVAGDAVVMLFLFVLVAAGVDSLPVLCGLLLVGYGFLGLVVPTTAVLALEQHGPIAGAASALMGTLQFMTGAVVMAIVGRFLDGTALPMVAGIAACSVAAFVLAQATLPRERPAAALAE